jgi:hypothetical protein
VGQCLKGNSLRVDGVDLSPGMVNKALESGHYSRVWQADIHDAMDTRTRWHTSGAWPQTTACKFFERTGVYCVMITERP